MRLDVIAGRIPQHRDDPRASYFTGQQTIDVPNDAHHPGPYDFDLRPMWGSSSDWLRMTLRLFRPSAVPGWIDCRAQFTYNNSFPVHRELPLSFYGAPTDFATGYARFVFHYGAWDEKKGGPVDDPVTWLVSVRCDAEHGE
jgi:hypothetical protein